jgi:molybdopterin/thiamine biosynthesis adenylyltransferase
MKCKIIVVGCGGTGSLAMGYLARMLRKTSTNVLLIDGDSVEDKNLERQGFSSCDVGESKAAILADEVQAVGLNNVQFISEYLIDKSQLPHEKGDLTILIGCVDNHRARQVMHQYFYSLDDCIYIDSANEFDAGEVCVAVRASGKDIAPPRGYYFPDVLTDRSPRADELGCDTVNISAPQHMITNSLMAMVIAKIVNTVMNDNIYDGGMIYCSSLKDPYTVMTRFAPWSGRAPSEEEVMPCEEVF